MKKIAFTAAMAMAALTTYAQQDLVTAQDAVRFSTDNLTGTARFRAMGGAFGALGGDLSAIGINPAGSAIFLYNTGTATVSSYNTNNKASFFGTNRKQNDNTFDLNQAGMVFVFNNNNPEAKMNKFAIGLNYENTQTFENIVGISGTNTNSSISDYFLRYANGLPSEGGITLGTLNNAYYQDLNFIDQQAMLGYNAYAFNSVNADDNNNTEYTSNLPANTNGRFQDSYIGTSGFNGKVNINFAVELFKKLYLGANANVHFTNYINTTTFYENTNNPTDVGLQDIQLRTERYTYGGGFSMDAGAIYKFSDSFRAGVAYQSPTWMRLQDEITQSVDSYRDNNIYASYNPGVTMVGDDYTIKTPGKWTFSAATIFGKAGLLSVDYAIRDYSNTEFKNYRYSTINDELSNTLGWAGELRVGTEWRVKNISLRGGYRFMQSPYKDGVTMGDLNGASAGIGFNFNGSRLDLAYYWSQRKSQVSTFTPGLTDAATVKTTNNNISLSYTIDL